MKSLISFFQRNLSKETTGFFLLSLLSVLILVTCVNLQPQVDQNFFFSSDDPQFQSEHRISELFIRNDTQLIISASGDIDSPEYFQKIQQLTVDLKNIGGVTGVKSISDGPRDLQDALKSPLWKRLLISDDQRSTNLILLIKDSVADQIIVPIEHVTSRYNSADFKINISGLPYVVELIRRNLLHDIKVFTTLAFIIFGCVIFLIFRSKSVLTGSMLCCLNACIWTFMITNYIDIPIGILTANLATIIFILTLSHIVFLTFNWQSLSADSSLENPAQEAVELTFPASFWSMLTTLLGFLSLLFVPAKPLRELGAAGAIGTVVAICTAYAIFPAFLRIASVHKKEKSESFHKRIFQFLEKEKKVIRVALCLLTLVSISGMFMIKQDPSMLSFFSKKSKIYTGLKYIDKNGGSSPLIIVVKTQNGTLLNTNEAYQKLWTLQEALEKHRSVGSVISLPVLMAEAKQEPLAFFLFWDWLIKILETPQFDEIAKSFITQDRQHGLFLLRMNETGRVQSRLDIIDELESMVQAHKFEPEIIGGVYKLQGHLSKLVVSSLVSGLSKLILLFCVIGWIASGSFLTGMAMTLSIAFIPILILGGIGLYRIPLDVISSPASNIAIAIGIDAMIHMVQHLKRKLKSGKRATSQDWDQVRADLWKPVATSMLIISLGFSIFFFSNFPPTQRFGGAIVFGSIVGSMIALYIMPWIATLFKKIPIKN